MKRYCRHCHAELVRKKNEKAWKFEKRITCNRHCAAMLKPSRKGCTYKVHTKADNTPRRLPTPEEIAAWKEQFNQQHLAAMLERH